MQGWAKNEKSAYANIVYFSNNHQGINTKVGLSDENLNTIKSIFKDDVYKSANGEYILTGEAESFVGGWFNEIAYSRGYLTADKDKSGAIDANELGDVKSMYSLKIFVSSEQKEGLGGLTSVKKVETVLYSRYTNLPLSPELDLDEKNITSIEEALNETLTLDKNKDGSLTLDKIIDKNEWIEYAGESIEKFLEDKNAKILVTAKIKVGEDEIVFDNVMLNILKDTEDKIYKLLFKGGKDDLKNEFMNLLAELTQNFDDGLKVDTSV